MNVMTASSSHAGSILLMKVSGQLDGSNYLSLIEQVRQVCALGVRTLVLDLSEVTYLSSAGLVALQSAALLLQGKTPPDPQDGWGTLRSLAFDQQQDQHHLKLLNPSLTVELVLRKLGMESSFEVYCDTGAAVSSCWH